MDPLLRVILDIDEAVPVRNASGDVPDPVGDFIFQQEHGIAGTVDGQDRSPVPLSPEQTAVALEQVRKSLGQSVFLRRLSILPKLAESARALLSEDSVMRQWLEAAVAGDDEGMRAAIRKMIDPVTGDIAEPPN
jgi:hypothetical protein